MQTNGKTSLLTVPTEVGKTTLIDALLTILVPGNKRFYNQSSGAEMKKSAMKLHISGDTTAKLIPKLKKDHKRNN